VLDHIADYSVVIFVYMSEELRTNVISLDQSVYFGLANWTDNAVWVPFVVNDDTFGTEMMAAKPAYVCITASTDGT
jgi:hypothetical protein